MHKLAQVPYSDMTPLQAAVGVVQKGLRPGIPPNCPPMLADLMVAAWEQHPASRPSFRDLTPRLVSDVTPPLVIDVTPRLVNGVNPTLVSDVTLTPRLVSDRRHGLLAACACCMPLDKYEVSVVLFDLKGGASKRVCVALCFCTDQRGRVLRVP
jgi:hypothetical protein